MTVDAQREEAINVRLADLLNEGGASARAGSFFRRRKKLPDVRVEWAGLRVVIEAKYEGGGASQEVERQVEERLQDALGDVGVALLYPEELRRATDVRVGLRGGRLRAKFAAPGREGEWQTLSGVADLSRCLEYARALLLLAVVLTLALSVPAAASAQPEDERAQRSGTSRSVAEPVGEEPAPTIPDYAFRNDGSVVMGGDVVTDCRSFAKAFRRGDLGGNEEQARNALDRCTQAGLLSSGDDDPSASVGAPTSSSGQADDLPDTGGLAVPVLLGPMLTAGGLTLRKIAQ